MMDGHPAGLAAHRHRRAVLVSRWHRVPRLLRAEGCRRRTLQPGRAGRCRDPHGPAGGMRTTLLENGCVELAAAKRALTHVNSFGKCPDGWRR